jgi:hypothetical protein
MSQQFGSRLGEYIFITSITFGFKGFQISLGLLGKLLACEVA